MPYPNTNPHVIVISQTSGSTVSGQYPFIERQISGSNLFLVTDSSGNLTGSTSIPGGSFTNLTVTGALTASIISASNAITAAAITSGPITASNISASGFITASNLNVATSIVVGSSVTIGQNLTVGAVATFTGPITASGNISASGYISSSNFVGTLVGPHTGSTFGTSSWAQSASNAITAQTASFLPLGTYSITSSWATNALTASNLVPINSYLVANLSASSGLSASNVSASGLFVNNNINFRELMNTGSLTPDVYITASAVTQSNITVQIDSVVSTGSAYALVLNASSSTVGIAYALSASSGLIVGTGFSGSSFSGSSFTGSITGQTLTMTGNSIFSGPITASNISSSLITASNLFVGTSIGVGSSVTVGQNLSVGANFSASGNVSGSNGWFNNLAVAGTITGSISGSITNANSASIAPNNSTATLQYITFVDGTGNRPLYVDQDSLTWQPSTNTLSSSGNIGAVNYTGSRITLSGGAGSSTAVGTQGILASNGIGVSGNSYFNGDVGIGTTLTVGGNISGSSAFWLSGNATLAGNSATVTHTGTGNLTISSNAGNVLIEGSTFNGNDVTVPGDVAINGGDLTTTATTFNLLAGATTTIAIGAATTTASHAGIIDVTNGTVATIAGAGSIATDGGVYIGKNLIVSGSTTLYGDVTMFGTGSIINISSSNIIIGDNRIQLNAWNTGGPQRYGGVDIFDSGSSAAVTSSILWDSLNNYWLLQTNQSGSSPVVTSSAIILQGPTSSFGSEFLLTVNNFLKVQTTTGNMITSSLSEVGNILQYAGTISASVVSGSTIFGATGSFINLAVVTGSAPNTGSQVPTSPSAAGLPGQIEVDNNFIYVYTNNLWKRTALNVWSA